MPDRFLTYAAVGLGAYYLLSRARPAAAGGNGNLQLPFYEPAPVDLSGAGGYTTPDVIPEGGAVACCMALTPACMECAARNWSGVTRGMNGGAIVYPSLSDQVRGYPDYGLRHPYTTQPVPY